MARFTLPTARLLLFGTRKLARVVHYFLHEVFFFVNVMNQTYFEGFFKRDRFAGGAEFQRAGFADQARQALRAAHTRHDAEIDFGEPDLAAFFFGDADIAGHGDLKTAADGVAVDRGDDDLRRVFQSHEDFVAVQREIILESRATAWTACLCQRRRKKTFLPCP